MQKISSCLWFDDQAEAAVNFYKSVFANTKIGTTTKYDEATSRVSGQKEGSILTVDFFIEGYHFTALNGGDRFKLNPTVSFFVNCKTAPEVNALYDKLADGGNILMPLDSYYFSQRYAWIQDKYGVSWQIILTEGNISQTIMPSLLFVGDNVGRAEEAVKFYTTVFRNSKKGMIFRYETGQEPDIEGTIAYADFELEGQPFAVMDSAQKHDFNFNEATSFIVMCNDQAEIDYYWGKLSAVPEAEQCGWLKDKYGVSWQIVPEQLDKLIYDPDPGKSARAMEAMLAMKKLDITELERAYNNNK